MVSITSPTLITSSAQIDPGTITGSDIASNAAIAHSKLQALTAGSVLLGSSGNVVTGTALSGDVTVDSAGVTAIANTVIVDGDVNASAAIALSKLAALPSTQIIVGNSSNVAAAAAMSGDVTIGNTGVTAIGSGKVTEAMQVLADNTTNNATTSAHGYLKKLDNVATNFMNGAGNWAAVGAGLTDIKFIGRATVTGSAASTVDFSSITAGFKGYLITCHMTTTSSVNWILLRVNNVTGASYTMNSMETNGTVVTAQAQTLTGLTLTENTAGEWAGIFAHVAQGNNAQAVRSASMANADTYKGCWYAEADALSADINQLTFYPNGNTFVIGSYFEIFGYS